MLNRNKIIVFVIVLAGFFVVLPDLFAAKFISVSELVAPPEAILTGHDVFAAYRFYNNKPVQKVHLADASAYPLGANITDGPGFCGKTSTLVAPKGVDQGSAYRYFCDFNLTFPAGQAGASIPFQPKKFIDGTCLSFWYPELNIRVVDTPQPGMPYLTIATTDPVFYVASGGFINITVKNGSGATAAHDIRVTMPASVQDSDLDLPNSKLSCVDPIAPLGTCNLKIQPLRAKDS